MSFEIKENIEGEKKREMHVSERTTYYFIPALNSFDGSYSSLFLTRSFAKRGNSWGLVFLLIKKERKESDEIRERKTQDPLLSTRPPKFLSNNEYFLLVEVL